jgi:hypothetical protein
MVPHVEHEPVLFRVENIMYGDGKLDHPEIGGKVAARFGNAADKEAPYLPAKRV